MKPIRTWILIADAARARVLENEGPGRGVAEVPGLVFTNELPQHQPGAGERGRAYESVSPTRHAVEPASDAHRLAERHFARELARMLSERHTAKSFDRLVLVATARMMGELRDALDPAVQKLVSGDLVADLTKVPDTELASHLGKVLAV